MEIFNKIQDVGLSITKMEKDSYIAINLPDANNFTDLEYFGNVTFSNEKKRENVIFLSFPKYLRVY